MDRIPSSRNQFQILKLMVLYLWKCSFNHLSQLTPNSLPITPRGDLISYRDHLEGAFSMLKKSKISFLFLLNINENVQWENTEIYKCLYISARKFFFEYFFPPDCRFAMIRKTVKIFHPDRQSEKPWLWHFRHDSHSCKIVQFCHLRTMSLICWRKWWIYNNSSMMSHHAS